jgi:hypothetical protein
MIAKDTGPLFIGRIDTECGKIFFGRMWADEEIGEFIRECNEKDISIIFSVMESSHGNIGKIREMWYPVSSVTEQSEEFTQLTRNVVTELKAGKNIFVHCLFGWGRTSHALSAIMVELGMGKEQAEATVRGAYPVSTALNIHMEAKPMAQKSPLPPPRKRSAA